MTHHHRTARRSKARLALAGVAAAAALLLSACGSSTPAPTSASTGATAAAGAGAPVLPVTTNPISNTSTAKTLAIDKVMVENNTDPSGAAVNDHLQFDVRNTGPTPLNGFEVYYTVADPTSSAKESYYLKLPATFTLDAGATKTIHFDNTGGPDHFPVNKYSLYYTSTAALQVTVEVSANGAAPVTTTVKKDPGGSENAGG